MALRVYIEEDKAPLFRALKASDGESGLFQTNGDVLTFAAVLGFGLLFGIYIQAALGLK